MKIGIVGSREFDDYEFVEGIFLNFVRERGLKLDEITIVSGGARGVDSIAFRIAKKYGLSIIIHFPAWDKYGKRAAAIRNQKIVKDSDVILAFPSKKSRGTWMTVDFAKRAGKEVLVFEV